MHRVHVGSLAGGAMIAIVIVAVQLVRPPLADNAFFVDPMLATAAFSVLASAYCLPRSLWLLLRRRR